MPQAPPIDYAALAKQAGAFKSVLKAQSAQAATQPPPAPHAAAVSMPDYRALAEQATRQAGGSPSVTPTQPTDVQQMLVDHPAGRFALSNGTYWEKLPSGDVRQLTREGSPIDVSQSAPARYVEGLGRNSLGAIPGFVHLVGAVLTPWKASSRATITSGVIDPSVEQGHAAVQAYQEGRPLTALGHAAAMFPMIGPSIESSVERIKSGDVSGGLGELTGTALLTGLLSPDGLKGAATKSAGSVLSLLPNADQIAEGLKNSAAEEFTRANGPRSTAQRALREQANLRAVAPDILNDPNITAHTQSGIVKQLKSGREAAWDAIVDAKNNRSAGRPIDTGNIVSALQQARQRYVAQAFDASRRIPEVTGPAATSSFTPATVPEQVGPLAFRDPATGRMVPVDEGALAVGEQRAGVSHGTPSPLRDADTGRFTKYPARQGRPFGQDQIPPAYRPGYDALTTAINQVKGLGPQASFDALNTLRKGYDDTADAARIYDRRLPDASTKVNEGQGYASAAGAVRDALTNADQVDHAAKTKYSLYKTAEDVVQRAHDIELGRPAVARKLLSALVGEEAGRSAFGRFGAIVGALATPVVNAAAEGLRPALQTMYARWLNDLGNAMNRGSAADFAKAVRGLRTLPKVGDLLRAKSIVRGAAVSGRELGALAPAVSGATAQKQPGASTP